MTVVGSMVLFTSGAHVMCGGAGLCGVAISLAFYVLNGLSFFFPWMELCFSYEEAVSEEDVSSGGAVECEYRMCDTLVF